MSELAGRWALVTGASSGLAADSVAGWTNKVSVFLLRFTPRRLQAAVAELMMAWGSPSASARPEPPPEH